MALGAGQFIIASGMLEGISARRISYTALHGDPNSLRLESFGGHVVLSMVSFATRTEAEMNFTYTWTHPTNHIHHLELTRFGSDANQFIFHSISEDKIITNPILAWCPRARVLLCSNTHRH